MGDEIEVDVADRTISDKDSVYRLVLYKALEIELGTPSVSPHKELIGYMVNEGLENGVIYSILSYIKQIKEQ